MRSPTGWMGPVMPIVPARMPTIPRAVKIMICPIGPDKERKYRQTNRRSILGNIHFPVVKSCNKVICINPSTSDIRANIAPLIVLLAAEHFKRGAPLQHMHGRKVSVLAGAQVHLSVSNGRICRCLRRCKHGTHDMQSSASTAETLIPEEQCRETNFLLHSSEPHWPSILALQFKLSRRSCSSPQPVPKLGKWLTN